MVYHAKRAWLGKLRLLILISSTLMLLLLASGCTRQTHIPGAPTVSISEENTATGAIDTTSIKARAQVQSVDFKSRKLTLRSYDGSSFIYQVDEEFQGLDQIRVGDLVELKIHQSRTVEVRPPTDEEKEHPRLVWKTNTAPGQSRPTGAISTRTVRAIVTVIAIDRTANLVTFRQPEGTMATVIVKDPSRLDKIKPNDSLTVTFSETVTILRRPS